MNGKNYMDLTFKAMAERIQGSIHVGELAKVTSIKDEFASVQPLGSNGSGRSTLNNVYITKQVMYVPKDLNDDQPTYRKLKVGDVVVVLFLDFDSDNFDGSNFTVTTSRAHSLNDAVIVGVI